MANVEIALPRRPTPPELVPLLPFWHAVHTHRGRRLLERGGREDRFFAGLAFFAADATTEMSNRR